MIRAFPVLLLVVCCAVSGCRSGEQYPSRPITLICPWSVGGGTDRVARQIAAQLERELAVPVNVVNASGGAGVTGHTRGALAQPDGYTITMITSELNMLHWRGLTNITHADYRPLMRVNRDYAALFVREDAPWSTLDELEAAIQARPRQLRASGTAFGGIWHVALAGWLIENGMNPSDVVWLSINGSAPSLQELMAGGIELVSCSVPEARSLLDADRIRCLGVMSEERLDAVPDAPTLIETGVDWTSFTWRGLALPRGVPEERIAILQSAVERVVTSDEYLEFCRQAGFGAAADGPAEFRAALSEENEAFGRIFRSEAFQSVTRQRYGPWLFPAVLGVMLVVAFAASVATSRGFRRGRDPAVRGGMIGILGAVGAVALYMLLVEPLGYVVTTALLLFGLFTVLRVRLPIAAVTAVVFAAASYHLFGVLLRVSLPWGIFAW